MGIFNIEPGLAVWTWITFGLLFWILSKFVFPTLYRNIKDREAAIAKAVDNADDIRKRLDNIEVEHQDIVNEARKEGDRIVGRVRREADELKRELSEKAEAEAEAIMVEAKARIGEERKLAVDAMQEDLVDLLCQGAEKIIGRSFVKDGDRAWTRELVDKL